MRAAIGGVTAEHYGERFRPEETPNGRPGAWRVFLPDRGCELQKRCLECRLPRCKFDYTDSVELNADVNRYLKRTTRYKRPRQERAA